MLPSSDWAETLSTWLQTFSLFNTALLLCMISFYSSTAQWNRHRHCHFKNEKKKKPQEDDFMKVTQEAFHTLI